MWNTLATTVMQQCANLRFVLNTQAVSVPLLDVIETLEYAVAVEPTSRATRKATILMLWDSCNLLAAFAIHARNTVAGDYIDKAASAILHEYNNYVG